MTKRLSFASAVMTAFASLLALLLLSSPVFAHHKNDHDKGTTSASSKGSGSDHDGDADSDGNTQYTEDNDTNDGGTKNNVADEGDNKHPSGKDRSVENGKSGNQGNSESDPDDDGRGPDRSNGGPDKPNGSGGDDLADQDGNNGCGNDDDFEDDNEGWCGKPKDKGKDKDEPEVLPTAPTPSPCPSPMTEGSTDGSCGEPEPAPCPTPMTGAGTNGTCGQPTVPTEVDGEEIDGDEDKECPEDATMALEVEGCEVVLGSTIEADAEVKDDVEAAGATADDAPDERAAGSALPFTGGNVVLFLVLAMGLLGVGFALLRTRRN